MNKELKNVSTWFKANKLSINIDITKWTTFNPTSKKRFMPTKFVELFIDSVTPERETVTQFLSLFIDENAVWKAHINTIPTKIYKSIAIFYRARLKVSRKQLNQLYFPFVYIYLNYANGACGSPQKITTLYCQQKHSIRLLRFKHQFSHSRPLSKRIGTLNVYEIKIFNISCLMFKCKNKACPKAFENLNKYQEKRSWTLLEPDCKGKLSQLCINYRGPHLWNTIVLSQNTDLEQSTTLKFFKEELKAYLFTRCDVTFQFGYCAKQEHKDV